MTDTPLQAAMTEAARLAQTTGFRHKVIDTDLGCQIVATDVPLPEPGDADLSWINTGRTPTPGQWRHFYVTRHEDAQRQIAAAVLQWHGVASDCTNAQHGTTLAEQSTLLSILEETLRAESANRASAVSQFNRYRFAWLSARARARNAAAAGADTKADAGEPANAEAPQATVADDLLGFIGDVADAAQDALAAHAGRLLRAALKAAL